MARVAVRGVVAMVVAVAMVINMKKITYEKDKTMPIKNTLLTLSLALAVTAPAVAREEAPIIYSNMTTTQMSTLLHNVGFLGMFDWVDKNDKHRGSVYYRWSAGGGVGYSCRFNTEYRQYKSIKFKEWSDIQKSRAFRTKYPVWIGKGKSGKSGYASLRYSPDDGGLNYYSYYKRNCPGCF